MSWRWRKRINDTAKRMLLSDAEFHILQDRWRQRRDDIVMGEECPVCKTFSTNLHPLCGCSIHRVCANCVQHASDSDVRRCVFCPVPDATLHLRCPCCAHVHVTMDMSAVQGMTCRCGHHFVPDLLRVFKRGPNIYTNFLSDNEKRQVQDEFHACGGRVQCPSCRHPIERESACNELFHCGYERVCAACGQFAFRWEAGLVQHRRESGCPCNPNPDDNEIETVRERVRQSYTEAGIL